ncbi:MAG: hypothetical protein N2Z85_02035 [Patescibacteria group bacterium]|nr:hypothetical protein [Patescibacteria group bacterium]
MSTILPRAVAVFETTLSQSISESDTTLYLTSAITKDGTELDADVWYGFVIDSGNNNEEFVIGQPDSSNRKMIKNLKRGVSYKDGKTEIGALKKAHSKGASVKITDAPILPAIVDSFNNAVNNFNTTSQAYDNYVKTLLVVNVSGTSYSVQLSDMGKMIKCLSNSATTITIPTDSALGITDNTIQYKFIVAKYGTGDVTIQGAPGVTLNNILGDNPVTIQYTYNVLLKNGSNNWLIY